MKNCLGKQLSTEQGAIERLAKFLGQMEAARPQMDTIRAAIKLLGGKSSVNDNRGPSEFSWNTSGFASLARPQIIR